MMAAAAAAGDASESSRPTEAASSPLRGAVQQVVAAAAHPAAEGSQGKAGSGDGAAAQQPRLVRLSRFRARNDNVEALGGERVRITLDAGESLCFCGSVSVRVESGALSVSGARLVPASGACDLHSPPWAPASLLELAPAGSATSKSASAPMRCVVTLAACAAKHLSAGPEVAEAAKVAAAEAPALCLAGFAPVFEAPTGVFAPLTVPDDWARALSEAAELRARSLVLVGPRGAGKSTLARLLVNRLLIRCTRVAMLDCDLGQSELAPPGLVGLAIIRRPLLGPPHTHSFWPDAAIFFGSESPAPDPPRFVECVAAAFARLETLARDSADDGALPLIVNTHGWIEGAGLEALRGVAAVVRPQLVLELRRIGAEAPTEASERRKWLDSQKPLLDPATLPPGAQLAMLGAFQPDATGVARPSLSPAHSRSLRFAAYFARGRPFSLATIGRVIASELPRYRVAFGAVSVGNVETAVEADHILFTLNGALVALCVSAALPPARDVRRLRVLRCSDAQKCVAECVGLGLIATIDRERAEFVVVTPLEDAAPLQRVNLLLRGGLDLPPLLRVDEAQAAPPYTSSSVLTDDTSGAGAMLSRKNLKRSRLG